MSSIIVLSEIYHPDETSTGYLLSKFTESLTANHKVTVITGPIDYGGVAPKKYVHNGVSVVRTWGTKFNRNLLFTRLINLITRSIFITAKCLSKSNSDSVILAISNPPSLPLGAYIVSKISGAKYVVLIHDSYPEALVAAGITGQTSLLFRVCDWIAHKVLNSAEKIIVCGRDMKALIDKKLVNKQSIFIPNFADCHEITQAPWTSNKIKKSLNLDNSFACLYAGNLGRTHGIEDVVAAARAMPEIPFIIIGFGAKENWLREQNISNIYFLGRLPRSEQQSFLGAGNVSIIPYVPLMKGVSVPSRMYNQMAAGRPIIAVAEEDSEIAMVIREEEIGWVVPPRNTEALCSAIKKAAENPELLQQMGARAAKAAIEKYSLKKLSADFQEAFLNFQNVPKAA